MPTASTTINTTSWTQISTGNVYVDNRSRHKMYWVASSTQPNISVDLASAHYIQGSAQETISLDQPIWARTVSITITIPVTEF